MSHTAPELSATNALDAGNILKVYLEWLPDILQTRSMMSNNNTKY